MNLARRSTPTASRVGSPFMDAVDPIVPRTSKRRRSLHHLVLLAVAAILLISSVVRYAILHSKSDAKNPVRNAWAGGKKDTLVMYVFSNTDPEYITNLRFFVQFAISKDDRCDYVIVVQTDADKAVSWWMGRVRRAVLPGEVWALPAHPAISPPPLPLITDARLARPAAERTLPAPRQRMLRLGNHRMGDQRRGGGHPALLLLHLHEQLRQGALHPALRQGVQYDGISRRPDAGASAVRHSNICSTACRT